LIAENDIKYAQSVDCVPESAPRRSQAAEAGRGPDGRRRAWKVGPEDRPVQPEGGARGPAGSAAGLVRIDDPLADGVHHRLDA
jgi:hypothetical protein